MTAVFSFIVRSFAVAALLSFLERSCGISNSVSVLGSMMAAMRAVEVVSVISASVDIKSGRRAFPQRVEMTLRDI